MGKPKQIFVENSLTLIGDNTDESESESEACNEEKERQSEENNIEKQQKAILDLLDSDEDDEDTVFQENSKNPVEKIRRRVFSEDMTLPRSSDLEDEMSRTSTLSDKENNAKKETTGETNPENAYFDDQRKKIENMLFSDDEDSNSENEDDSESVNEDQSAEPSVDNEKEVEEEGNTEVNDDSRTQTGEEGPEVSTTEHSAKVKEEVDSKLGILLYSTLNEADQVKKDM